MRWSVQFGLAWFVLVLCTVCTAQERTVSNGPVSGGLDAAESAAGGAGDARVTALVAGLKAYEASIVSLAWQETRYLPPDSSMYRDEWFVAAESRKYWDIAWHWMIDERLWGLHPGATSHAVEEDIMVGDGVRRLAWVEAENHGLLTEPDVYLIGGLQLLRAFGRSYDFDGAPHTASLSSLIESAQSVEYMPPTVVEPWPGLHAQQVLRTYDVDVEVRLDPERGMMPRVLRMIRPQDGLVADELVVMSTQEIDSVHIAEVCVHGPRYAQLVKDLAHPVPEEYLDDMEVALRLEGLPDSLRTPEVHEIIKRMQDIRILDRTSGRVSGQFTILDRGAGIAGPQILVVSDLRINQPLDIMGVFGESNLDGEVEKGKSGVYDGFTGEFITLREALAQLRESPLNPILSVRTQAAGGNE